jgi:hypothetical protein
VRRPSRGSRFPKRGRNDRAARGIAGFNHIRIWRALLRLARQPQREHDSFDAIRNPVGRMQADWNDIGPAGRDVERLIAARWYS